MQNMPEISSSTSSSTSSSSSASTTNLTTDLSNIVLPPYGEGMLTDLINKTSSSMSLFIQRTLHDALPDGTTLRIKSQANNKYYTVKKVIFGARNQYTDYVFAPDTNPKDINLKDPSKDDTIFTVHRYLDYNLNDWIAFSHKNALDYTVSVDSNGKAEFLDKDFEGDEFQSSQWKLESINPNDLNKALDACFIQNRTINEGCLHSLTKNESYQEGKEETIGVPCGEVWGTSQALMEHDPNVYLTGNSLITFRMAWNNKAPAYWWTFGANDFGLKDINIFQGWDRQGRDQATGSHCFLIQKAGDPGYEGILKYGDKVEISATWENGPGGTSSYNHALVPPPGKKWWVYKGNRWGSTCSGTMLVGSPKNDLTVFVIKKAPSTFDESKFFWDSSDERRFYPSDENGPIKPGDNVMIEAVGLPDQANRLYGGWRSRWGWNWEFLVGDTCGDEGFSARSIFKLEKAPDTTYTQQISKAYDLPAVSRSSVLRCEGTAKFEGKKAIDFSGPNKKVRSDVIGMGTGFSLINKASALNIAQIAVYRGKAVYKNEAIDLNNPARPELAWGVTQAKKLVKWTSGDAWQDTGTSAVSVSVGGDGAMWYVDKNNKVYNDFKAMNYAGTIKQIAAKNKDEAWGIALGKATPAQDPTKAATPATDKLVRYSKDQGWQDAKDFGLEFTLGTPTFVAVSDYQNAVWVVYDDGNIARLKNGAWSNLPALPPVETGDFVVHVGVQHDGYAWATTFLRHIFFWNGVNWIEPDPSARWATVAVSVGAYNVQIGNVETKTRTVTRAYVSDGKGAPYPKNSDALVALEVVTPGPGFGGVDKGSSRVFHNLSFRKNPHTLGYAENTIRGFEGVDLTLQPLVSRGVAWLTTSGKPSISFYALSDYTGNIQVVFGNEKTKDYTYKIIIGQSAGGVQNVQSVIQKRTKNNAYDIPMPVTKCVVLAKDDPLAVASPGNFAQFWASLDFDAQSNEALILVGRGEIGENVFMAYRDPQALPSSFVGFSTDKQPVVFTEIKQGDEVVTKKPTRIYATFSPGDVGGPSAFVWEQKGKNLRFKVPDQGSVGFTLTGQGSLMLALSATANDADDHYIVIFGSNGGQDLQVQKWSKKTNKYSNIGPVLKGKDYPYITLDGTAKNFWVSYIDGKILIGKDAMGTGALLVIDDPLPSRKIKDIGFKADGSVALQRISIASEVNIGFATQTEFYKKARQLPRVTGDVDILIPFEYVFQQQADVITMRDIVSGKTQITYATPQQGAIYYLGLFVDPTGKSTLFKTREVENPVKIKLLAQARQIVNQARLKLVNAGFSEQRAALDKAVQDANANYYNMRAQAATETANYMDQVGVQLMQTGGQIFDPTLGKIVVGTGLALTGGSVARVVASEFMEKQSFAAAAKAGNVAQIAGQQQSVEQQQAAAMLQLQANIVQQRLATDFKPEDAYVYSDVAQARELGSTAVAAAAQAHQNDVMNALAKLDQDKTRLHDAVVLQDYLTECENILAAIDQSGVLTDASVRQRIWNSLDVLYTAVLEIKASPHDTLDIKSRMKNILFAALINPYLADDTTQRQRDIWFNMINEIAKDLFLQSAGQGFVLSSQLGEYLWYPQQFTVPDQGSIVFDAKGLNDFMVCFWSRSGTRLKGSDQEIYEIAFGAFQNESTVIRMKNMGRAVAEFHRAQYPDAMLNTLEFESYWININHGQITVGKGRIVGAHTLFSWTDPYPVKGIKYIGFSCWDVPIAVRNIKVGPAMHALTPTSATPMTTVTAGPETTDALRPVSTAKTLPMVTKSKPKTSPISRQVPKTIVQPVQATQEQTAVGIGDIGQ